MLFRMGLVQGSPKSPRGSRGAGPADSSAPMKRRLLAIGLVSMVVLVSGCEFSCSIGNSISPDELERQVKNSYEKEVGLPLSSITCEEAKPDRGSPISCRAINAPGVTLWIEGRVTSYDSGTQVADFDWEVVRAESPGRIYANAAAATIEQEWGFPVDRIECPDRIRVETGEKVECIAVQPDGTRTTLILTLTDDEGGFDIQVRGPTGKVS